MEMNVSPPLTADERTCLEICNEGGSLAPIGRWKEPVLKLEARGLLQCHDAMNYGVTAAGRAALEEKEKEDDQALVNIINLNNQVATGMEQIRQQLTQCANVLAAASKATSELTGETARAAFEKWSQVVLIEAKRILDEQDEASPHF